MYTNKDNIERALGRSLTPTESARLDLLLGSIDAYINRQTGTVFGSSDEVEVYVSGNGTSRLVIPTMHAITSVKTEGGDTISADSYRLYPATGPYLAITHKSGSWSDGFDNYIVTGKLGYSEATADIEAVATELAVSQLSAKRDTDGTSVKSERVGDWSITYDNAPGLSVNSMATLEGYTRLSRSI